MAIHFICADAEGVSPELGEILTELNAIRVINNTLWMIESADEATELHKRLQSATPEDALVVISPADNIVSTNHHTAQKSSTEIIAKLEGATLGAFSIGRVRRDYGPRSL